MVWDAPREADESLGPVGDVESSVRASQLRGEPSLRRLVRTATGSTDDQHTDGGGSADADAVLEEDAAEAGGTGREATSAASAGQDGRDPA